MAGRRTSTQEMMARLEVIEEEDTVTRSSVEGVHNKTSASTKATLAKINETLQEMQQKSPQGRTPYRPVELLACACGCAGACAWRAHARWCPVPASRLPPRAQDPGIATNITEFL